MSLAPERLPEDWAPRFDLALRLADGAGALQRERYESELDIRTKSAPIDLVTEVDHACEALVVEGIGGRFPEDAILAEEGGERGASGGRFRWVVDPLDGTTNFAHGFPRFAVSIGVEEEGRRVLGVVYDPLLDECFHAARGHGAWLGGRRLRVSGERDLARALVLTGFAYDIHRSADDNLGAFARMAKAARGIRRDGSAALDLCYVAAGRVGAYWEFKLKPWDVAAGLLMVEEAGGRCTGSDGAPAPASGEECVASNGALHDAVLAILDDAGG